MGAKDPKDGQIIVRASKADIERWFEAARLATPQGMRPTLSRHVVEILNAWAMRVIRANGEK